MNAHSPGFAAAHRLAADPSSTSLRWSAVHEAARVAALLAGEPPEIMARSIRNFPALIRDTEPWRQELADKGIADLAAIMEPGLAALLAVGASGNDGRAAAAALWHEFCAARATVLDLLPPRRPMASRA